MWLDRSATPAEAATGWIRPFVIRLNLEESHYPEGFSPYKNTGRNAFYRLLNSVSLKYVQPLLPRSSDTRWCFLQTWWQRIQSRSSMAAEEGAPSRLTAVERLIFHPHPEAPPARELALDDCPWYPFFVLDHLEGSFHVTGFGKGRPEFWWCPPDAMPSNLRWFAEYWVAHWGGRLGKPTSFRREAFGMPSLPRVHWRLGSSIQGSRREIDSYVNSVVKTLDGHPASGELGSLQSFLLEVFASPELQGIAEVAREVTPRFPHGGERSFVFFPQVISGVGLS